MKFSRLLLASAGLLALAVPGVANADTIKFDPTGTASALGDAANADFLACLSGGGCTDDFGGGEYATLTRFNWRTARNGTVDDSTWNINISDLDSNGLDAGDSFTETFTFMLVDVVNQILGPDDRRGYMTDGDDDRANTFVFMRLTASGTVASVVNGLPLPVDLELAYTAGTFEMFYDADGTNPSGDAITADYDFGDSIATFNLKSGTGFLNTNNQGTATWFASMTDSDAGVLLKESGIDLDTLVPDVLKITTSTIDIFSVATTAGAGVGGTTLFSILVNGDEVSADTEIEVPAPASLGLVGLGLLGLGFMARRRSPI